MRRLLLVIVALVGAALILRWMLRAGKPATGAGRWSGAEDGPKASRLVRDPVCSLYLPQDKALSLRGKGQNGADVWFCSDACRAEWLAIHSAAS